LQFLYLELNGIKDGGAVALAEALKDNKTLTSLDLKNNEISGIGCEALLTSLTGNTRIVAFDLYGNDVAAHRNAINDITDRNVAVQRAHQYEEKMIFMDTLNQADTSAPWNRAKLMVVGQGKKGKNPVRNLLRLTEYVTTT